MRRCSRGTRRRGGRCCWSIPVRAAAARGSRPCSRGCGPAAWRSRRPRSASPRTSSALLAPRATRRRDRLRRRRQPLPRGAGPRSRPGSTLGILPRAPLTTSPAPSASRDGPRGGGGHHPRRPPAADRPRHVNGKPFFNVASIGLATELARELSAELKRRWGRLGYAVAAPGCLPGPAASRPGSARTARRCDPDACRSRSATAASTAAAPSSRSTRRSTTGTSTSTAWRCDGLEARADAARASAPASTASGPRCATARGTEFEIRTRRPRPVNADGELITETPAVFQVHPGAVEVFAPAPEPEA